MGIRQLLFMLVLCFCSCKQNQKETLVTNETSKARKVKPTVLPENAQLLEFTAERPEDYLQEIITNAQGKVIYIDNWATWCGPCKVAFKEGTPSLKENFEDQVEFVYLCYQSKETLWRPTIAEYEVSGKHYFIPRGLEASLIAQLGITAFPTYSIINKKGELVQSGHEFRPGLPETSKLLADLIQQQP